MAVGDRFSWPGSKDLEEVHQIKGGSGLKNRIVRVFAGSLVNGAECYKPTSNDRFSRSASCE